MPRALDASVLTDITAIQAEACLLIEIQFGTGTLYLTDAGTNLPWNGQTWVAVGGALAVPQVSERWELGASAQVTLSGVDQAILADILQLQYKGRKAIIRWTRMDRAAGTVLGTPITVFSGLMNDAFQVQEVRDPETGAGTVTITTRLAERLSSLGKVRGVRTNMLSHQAAASKDGTWATGIVGAATDKFFEYVHQISGTRIYWGTDAPYQGAFPGGQIVDTRPSGPGGGGTRTPGGGTIGSPWGPQTPYNPWGTSGGSANPYGP